MTISMRKAGWAALFLSSLICTTSHAEVVVVVGAKSQVTSMTQQQVKDLYLGRTRAFPNGSPAITSMLASGPTRDEFLSTILEKTESQARSTWSRLVFTGVGNAPRDLKDPQEAKQLLSANPNVIGILDRSALDATVKVVLTPPID